MFYVITFHTCQHFKSLLSLRPLFLPLLLLQKFLPLSFGQSLVFMVSATTHSLLTALISPVFILCLSRTFVFHSVVSHV